MTAGASKSPNDFVVVDHRYNLGTTFAEVSFKSWLATRSQTIYQVNVSRWHLPKPGANAAD